MRISDWSSDVCSSDLAVILLKRRDGMSLQAFSDWLLQDHVPLALKLDGLKRYQVNIAQPPDGAYDGVSELWFASEDAMLAPYGTRHGYAVAADAHAYVMSRERMSMQTCPHTPTASAPLAQQ